MPDIGWVTLAEAETFFDTRYGCDAWIGFTDAKQTALLTTAWNRILYDPRWTIPATPSAAEKAKLAYAQELTAWYMEMHLPDEDRRKGLQAQGVISAGIVQEAYDKDRLDAIPLPAEAIGILDELCSAAPGSFFVLDIDRKESVGANQDVTETDNSLNESGVY